uniref:DEP domain-containing protein n=1 Tax=Macrostomum lignano TaxID=282301 RepID=A0A1I8IV92_9PLAT
AAAPALKPARSSKWSPGEAGSEPQPQVCGGPAPQAEHPAGWHSGRRRAAVPRGARTSCFAFSRSLFEARGAAAGFCNAKCSAELRGHRASGNSEEALPPISLTPGDHGQLVLRCRAGSSGGAGVRSAVPLRRVQEVADELAEILGPENVGEVRVWAEVGSRSMGSSHGRGRGRHLGGILALGPVFQGGGRSGDTGLGVAAVVGLGGVQQLLRALSQTRADSVPGGFPAVSTSACCCSFRGFPSDRFHVLGGVVTNGSFFPARFRPAEPPLARLRFSGGETVSARLGDGLVNYDAIGRQLRSKALSISSRTCCPDRLAVGGLDMEGLVLDFRLLGLNSGTAQGHLDQVGVQPAPDKVELFGRKSWRFLALDNQGRLPLGHSRIDALRLGGLASTLRFGSLHGRRSFHTGRGHITGARGHRTLLGGGQSWGSFRTPQFFRFALEKGFVASNATGLLFKSLRSAVLLSSHSGIVLSGGRGCLRGIGGSGVAIVRLGRGTNLGWCSSSLGRQPRNSPAKSPAWRNQRPNQRTISAVLHWALEGDKRLSAEPADYPVKWNDIIRTFRTSMPVGRHRKGVRVFDNCFQGSDAVDWLQLHLSKNPSFGSNVGRHQVVQLLGKFHKSGVFHDVRGGGGNSKYDTEPFEDSSSRLYKFSLVETTLSPLSARQPITAMDRSVGRRSLRAGPSWSVRKATSLSASSSASGGAACATPVRRPPEPREPQQQLPQAQPGSGGAAGQEEEDLAYIWLDSALTRMRELLELCSIDALTDARQLRADFVRDNLTSAGQAGDPADSLPAWVSNAVRCLARWPDTGMPSLPSYEGFELEIFAELCEFFEGRDAEPLVPPDLRDLFINVLALADNLASERAAHDAAARRRHRRRFRRHPIGAPAMTSSCAEIMRQLTAPGASATDDADCSDANWSLMNQPRCRLARVCHSDCEFDAEDDGEDADDFAACRRRRRHWPRRSPLRRSATSEADGLGREQELLQSVQDPGNAADGGVHPLDGDSLLASGLQLAALFLPPSRRRRLHQLLRAMHKLGANPRLRLDPVLPTAHVVLHSLASCVLRRKPEVREPRHPQSEQPDVFALQLGLLSDENLPAREKRRKLRLFKESHPHVYAARFPDAEVERSVLDSLRGPPAAPGLLGRTIAALRNWRL